MKILHFVMLRPSSLRVLFKDMQGNPPFLAAAKFQSTLQPPVVCWLLCLWKSVIEASGRGLGLVGMRSSCPLAGKASMLGVLKHHLGVR